VDGEVISSTVTAVPPKAGGVRQRELKPLVADWLKDREEFVSTVKDAGHRAGHNVLWHVVHSPLHAGRVLKYAPRGWWRVTTAIWGWIFHAETKGMRREHALNHHTPEWLRLEKERKERVSLRWRGTLFLTVLVLAALVLLWFLMPNIPLVFGVEATRVWVFSLLGSAVMCALGYVGRPVNAPLLRKATDVTGNPPLTSETVLDALVSLRIAGMNDPAEIRMLIDVPSPRAGYLFELELPKGVAAESVMDKRSELSAALRHPLGTVWPSVGKRHQGHLVLFVSHEDMAKARQKPWPLRTDGAVDVFKPQPMFTDQRNRWVELTLAYTSGVIGAVPRMGKTFALREFLLVGALDVRCVIYAYDLKGTGDLSCMQLVAHCYGVGDEEEDIRQQLSEMRALREEMRRRTKVIRGLPREECPENKVTTDLASRRSLGLEPILVGVDECQAWFEYENTAIAKELITICTDLVKRGPAVGIMCYFATQKPDAKSLPTGMSSNAVVRLCFKVEGHISNDQVLGSGMYKAGLKATMFSFDDKAIAYLKGEGSEPQIVRSVHGLDAVAAEKVALRARAMRELSNRLTGFATGDDLDHEAEQVVLLDDVRRVFENAKAMHLTDIAVGLAELRPLLYGNLDADSLGRQLRAAGVEVDSVYVSGKPREKASNKGVKREWLDVSSTVLVGDDEVLTESGEPS
jgi:S-DNA-T family DNA segregation ATPase FtsK/SpoIIIE